MDIRPSLKALLPNRGRVVRDGVAHGHDGRGPVRRPRESPTPNPAGQYGKG
jgi:hypothetical protein